MSFIDQPGYYLGVFKNATAENRGKNDTPFLCLYFDVTHSSQADQWAAVSEPTTQDVTFCINENVWNNPTAKRILIENLSELGFNGDFANPTFNSDILRDNTVIKATQKGKYLNWNIEGLGGTHEKKPLSGDVALTLNARYNAAAAVQSPPSAAPQAPAPVPAPAPGDMGPGRTLPQGPPEGYGRPVPVGAPGGDAIPFR